MKSYQLTDGGKVFVEEHTSPGMAGEPMTVLNIRDERGNKIPFREVVENVNHSAAHELREWSDCLADVNESNAIAFAI